MKKLLYRLPCSRSFARLFSILTVAFVAFVAPGLLQAATGTKCNKPLTTKVYCDLAMTPAPKAKGTSCVASSLYKSTGVSCTGTVGGAGTFPTGSHVDLLYQFGDLVVDTVPSVCGTGYVDQHFNSAPGQDVACSHVDDLGNEVEARCAVSGSSSCIQVGDCPAKGNKTAERRSQIICPTAPLPPLTVPNAAGFKATVTVTALDGTQLAQVQIGEGQENFDKNICGAEYSKAGLFPRFVEAIYKSICDSTSNISIEQFTEVNIRTYDDYFSTTTERVQTECLDINPHVSFVVGACFDAGIVFVDVPIEDPSQCVASNYRCGSPSDGSEAPLALDATLQSGLVCKVKCNKCSEGVSLVNPGTFGQGLFVVSDSVNSCAIPVTVVGN
jgi:hypothetical protein